LKLNGVRTYGSLDRAYFNQQTLDITLRLRSDWALKPSPVPISNPDKKRSKSGSDPDPIHTYLCQRCAGAGVQELAFFSRSRSRSRSGYFWL